MRFAKIFLLTVLALGMAALPASARRGGGGGHHHHGGGGGTRWSVGFGYPLFWPGYYGYGPGYYYEPPVVVGRASEGSDVVGVQRELARRGYYRGAIDGIFGPQTLAGLQAWQRDAGIPVTGRMDARTMRSLSL